MEIQYMMEICMSTRQRVIEDFMAGIRFELGPKEQKGFQRYRSRKGILGSKNDLNKNIKQKRRLCVEKQ